MEQMENYMETGQIQELWGQQLRRGILKQECYLCRSNGGLESVVCCLGIALDITCKVLRTMVSVIP